MTTPLENALSYKEADELLALELQAASKVTAEFRKALAMVRVLLAQRWPGDNAPVAERRAVIAALPLDRMLQGVTGLEAAIMPFAQQAMQQGVENAVAQAALGGLNVAPVPLLIPGEVATAIGYAPDALREQVRMSKILLAQAQTLADVNTGLAVAEYGITRVEATARYATNSAANSGLDLVVSNDDRIVSVWRAERDACLHCLAYAGKVDTGKGYPTGLTFGDKPLDDKPVKRPPLHPNCRCDQVVWSPDWPVDGVSIPEALRREAERSVLRGWSVESESNAARLRAAQRLLQNGTALPKSVKQYASVAIKRGEFPRGTEFPGAR